jgi:hypothetical protein
VPESAEETIFYVCFFFATLLVEYGAGNELPSRFTNVFMAHSWSNWSGQKRAQSVVALREFAKYLGCSGLPG